MQYRRLAGERVSQLGFGAMRLPTVGGAIDEPASVAMIRRAIDAGVNYLDTAWPYHGGESETLVGKALREGYREKTFLATKSPVWKIEGPGDFEDILDKQLAKLRTDRIDFYLLHALNVPHWETCVKHDALEFGRRMKEAGKIRHFGFSFHDALPVFKTIIDAHDWEFCQIQYNYLDRKEQAGLEGLAYARSKGVGVVVMEPLRGGNLAGPVPGPVQDLWDAAPSRRTPVDWALRWIWDHEGVATVLSGMSTMEQLEENLALAADAVPGCLTDGERELVDRVERAYQGLIGVHCTACGYCMPCPSGVDIPRNFGVWNEYHMFGKTERSKGGYPWIPEADRAHNCTECGECLPRCPQSIAIPDVLKDVAAELAS